VLALLYLLSFLDRTNVGAARRVPPDDRSWQIGNARLFGLEESLNLEGMDYPACLAIFFAFYVLFEVPRWVNLINEMSSLRLTRSNMVMKAWRPSRWLPLIMLAWGVVITLTGIVQNFTGLFIARIFVSRQQPS